MSGLIAQEQNTLSIMQNTTAEKPAPKKRGRPRKIITDESATLISSVEEAVSEPKRRGRPRKTDTASSAASIETSAENLSAPKKRGRPRKNPIEEAATAPSSDSITESTKAKRGRPRKVTAESTEVASTVLLTTSTEPKSGEKIDIAVAKESATTQEANDDDKRAVSKNTGTKTFGSKGRNSRAFQGGLKSKSRDKDNIRKQKQKSEIQPSVSREELAALSVIDLRRRAIEAGVDPTNVAPELLAETIYEKISAAEGFVKVGGILDIMADGYGFLRTQGYLPDKDDVYVGAQVIKRHGLRKGDYVTGQTRPTRENDKFAALRVVYTVNEKAVEEAKNRIKFGDLKPVYPDEMLTMEHGHNTVTARVIDLVSPIGKGQRGLIVSPPKAGKTTILKDIAAAISANNPEVHLMCLLVDERPEEVTDMERSVKGEVISSTFDMPTENHIAVAELVIERAKRLVEEGKDVVILLDSITRLARAYNLAQPVSGRILSGGVDSAALYPPKRFLGAARNIEGGGSLTILASALVDTGSRMDEVIFEEFKGTGNMELKLDRSLADRRIFPAIDPVASGTRKEELLLDPQEAPLIWAVRRMLANMNNTEKSMDMLIKSLKQTENNDEFLERFARKAQRAREDSFEL